MASLTLISSLVSNPRQTTEALQQRDLVVALVLAATELLVGPAVWSPTVDAKDEEGHQQNRPQHEVADDEPDDGDCGRNGDGRSQPGHRAGRTRPRRSPCPASDGRELAQYPAQV